MDKEHFEIPLLLRPLIQHMLNIPALCKEGKMGASMQSLWALLSKRIILEAEKVQEIIGRSFPNPIVYYIGIGNIERLNLDILAPLVVTDFSRLIGVDIGPYKKEESYYEDFIRALTLNLAVVNEINQEKISFEKLGNTKFSARFPYRGLTREVLFYAKFDAGVSFPEELGAGFQVFFTRQTNDLFCRLSRGKIPENIRDQIMNLLDSRGLAIFQEIVGLDEDNSEFKKSFQGRLEWLGKEFKSLSIKIDESQLAVFSFERLICFRKKLG